MISLSRRTHTVTPSASWSSSNLPLKPGYNVRRKFHRISCWRTDLVKFCMVLQGLPRTIILLNSSTLIHVQDTPRPRSSFFRQLPSSFVVSTAIHQGRTVFLVNPLSRGSPATSFPMPCCRIEIHSLSMSTFHICALVEPLFVFTFWCLKSSFVPGVVAVSISINTSANFRLSELPLYAVIFHIARTLGAVS